MPPHDLDSGLASDALAAQLGAVLHRIRLADLLRAVAIAAATTIVVLLILTASRAAPHVAKRVSAASAVGLAVFAAMRRRKRWTHGEAARLLEHAVPSSHNVIVTSEELLRNPAAGRSAVRSRVFKDARAAASRVAPADVVPLRTPVILSALALTAWVGAALALPDGVSTMFQWAGTAPGRAAGTSVGRGVPVTATITSPSYLGSSVKRVENPERLEAVAGSQLALTLGDPDRSWSIRLGASLLKSARTAEGTLASVVLTETTYVAIEESTAHMAADRKLIPIVVTPDRAPAILIDQPGKDLLLPNSRTTVPVSATASDDFGMRSLELRFTRVSGSGEQFQFEEGVIPLQVERMNVRSWKGRTALALADMKLQPGDAVVYRVVGSDARGGESGAASSDTFYVEIAGPGQVSPAGFELPPDRERYALSQQMIVLKIQRLRAREKNMSPEGLAQEAASIAAEQRSVRANFIFLTGGHVEDEEEEAEQSHEIQEGRLEHSARREINAAIQYMSRAEQALGAVSTGGALPPARAAVEALQRAFGRNRYFLRTLPVRSRVDASRRLSGDLDEARDSRRSPQEAAVSPSDRTARELLGALLDLAPGLSAHPREIDPAPLTSLAERALSVNPASAEWQRISASVLSLKGSIAAGGSPSQIDTLMETVVAAVRSELQRGAIPSAPADQRNQALRSAWHAPRVQR